MPSAQQIAPTIVSQQSGSDESSHKKGSSQIKLKWVENIYIVIKTYALDFIALSACMILGYILAAHFFSNNESQYTNGILASSQILLNKGLRGVFPPLSGTEKQLLGKWNVQVINSLEKSQWTQYNQYLLNFKSSGDVELLSLGCQGRIRLRWKTFSYNIHIKQVINNDSQMQIPNDPQDIVCLKGNGKFFDILSYVSIWTVQKNQLFIVSEIPKGQQMDNYMMILKRS